MKINLVSLLIVSFCIAAANAATVVGPPVETALSANNIVASMRLIDLTAGNTARFIHLDTMHNRGEGEISLRLPRSAPSLHEGSELVVVYTYHRPHPIYRNSVENRSDPYVVQLPGVGAAVFESSPDLLELFARHKEDLDHAVSMLDRLLSLLSDSNDNAGKRLAAMELQMHPELYSAIKRRHRRALATVVRPRSLPPQTQQMLIAAMRQMPDHLRPRWLATTCRETLDASTVELQLASYVPMLLIRCTRVLLDVAQPRDRARLARHLGSNAPGVGQGALDALVATGSERARELVLRALGDGVMHPETEGAARAWLRNDNNAAIL